MALRIPIFYRFIFTWFDFLNCLLAAYLYFFNRDIIAHSMHPTSQRNPDHDLLYYQMGGTMLLIGILHGVLLRYTSDVRVWKIVNFGVLMLDLAILAGTWDALGKRHVRDPRSWRGDDWSHIGLTTFVTIVRLAFLADVGMEREKKA